MLFKNIVFVAAMLLSPSTVAGRTLKSNKGADKREKRLEEKIDALTTLVEQIVANNDRDDSALGELCGQAIADKFACENEASEIDVTPESVKECALACGGVLSLCAEACLGGIIFPPAVVACEVACGTAEVVCTAACATA